MSIDTHQKVSADHLRRDAFLYVRQSSLRQVFENTESTKRQYALRERAVALGWPAERIHTIDSDLGVSGARAENRDGFQYLVKEVALGHAGIVLGLEVSRLARNNADWHRLLELAAFAQTLILDEDGVYDPAQFNDRLLLGLKGAMSEAELHVLKARLQGGLRNKARRGDLQIRLPIGFVYDACGAVVLDPDQQIQDTLRIVFDTFRQTGSATSVVRRFQREGLTFPRPIFSGINKGDVLWGRLNHSRVIQVLHNPRYAGKACQTIRGREVDAAVSAMLLETVAPAALEVALAVQDEIAGRIEAADALRRSQLERARYDAELARRRYLKVDPDHRLVANTLESDWNERLRRLDTLQQEHDRQRKADQSLLNEEARARILALSRDFPRVWKSLRTASVDRKRMLALLIEDVTLVSAERIAIHVRFRGGQAQSLAIDRPKPIAILRKTHPVIVQKLEQLLKTCSDREAAAELNAVGYRNGRKEPFTARKVRQLRRNYKLPSRFERLRARGLLSAQEMASKLDLPLHTIYQLVRTGVLHREHYGNTDRCLFKLNDTGPSIPSKVLVHESAQ
jgi:DNA invertase Pin-like site-specific DNA recombinase